MNKILIIDSHKGYKNSVPQNLHWKNSKAMADYLGADLIWSYHSVRFYEALNYNCVPIFTKECKKTVELSEYDIDDCYFINDSSEIKNKNLAIKKEWHTKAIAEKAQTLINIKKIIV